ncbi:MAG TPA: hypothetical protein VHE55_08570 [Fimbriimonadaceae bacterium]|nr:hypothetical protein [Fimbriimonadaceae bacterium]
MTCGAIAADYRLSVDATADQLAKAKTLRVYGFRFDNGDRIVSVVASKGVSGVQKISLDTGVGSSAVDGTHEGFAGKVLVGSGQSPAKSLTATMDVVPPAAAPNLKDRAKGFLNSTAGLSTIGALVFLVGAAAFALRPKKGHREPSLPNRRKSIDESLKDIVRRLELVDENQRELVKKPPMLRSFRAQIDNFDSRLKRLETQLESLQGMTARNSESLGSLGRGHKDVLTRAEAHDVTLGETRQTLEDLRAALNQLGKDQVARAEESLSHLGKQAMELQNRLAAVERTGEEQHAKLAAELSKQLSGLAAAFPKAKDYDAAFADLAKRIAELPQPKSYDAALEAISKQVAGLPAPKDYEAAFAELSEQLAALPQPKDYDETLRDLTDKIASLPEPKDYEPALAGLAERLDKLPEPKNYDQELQRLAHAAEESKAAIAAAAGELAAKLDSPSSGKEFGEVAAQQRRNAESLQALASRLEELRSALEARIGEIGARTDQREELLLSLQSRVADSDGKAAEGSELLPVIAGLRLELQSLTADQAKVSGALDALSQSVANLSREPAKADDAAVASLAAEQAKLAEAIAGLNFQTLSQKLEALGKAQESLTLKLDSLGGSQADPALGEAIAALKNDLASRAAPSSPDSGLQEALQTLSTDLETWKTETEQAYRSFDERLLNESRVIETLTSALLQWRAEGDANRAALEERLSAKVETLSQQAPAPVAVLEETEPEPLVIEIPEIAEIAEIAEPVAQAVTQIEPAGEEEAAPLGGWTMEGGSQSRRWSSPVPCPVNVVASDRTLIALTPTITASTEFPVGPALYLNKKVVYGHGPNLCGAWPGKTTSTAALQEPLPADPWRLAAIDGHAFCVEEDQVEVVSLSAWRVVARFSGIYVDQICTDTHWVGLATSMGKLSLDYRNTQGRQFGTPVELPMNADDYRALAANGEQLFVAAKSGRILRVELGEASEFAPADKDIELLSLSVQKSGLVALVRSGGKDTVRLYGSDGKLQKQLSLGFANGASHPVHIGERLYLVDSENRKLVTVNLKKLEVAGSSVLPGDKVSSFCGVFQKDQHALLATVGDGEHARLLVLDPKSGAAMAICDVKEPTIYVLVAESKVVVATSAFYQNMIRVFDPFKAGQAAQAA